MSSEMRVVSCVEHDVRKRSKEYLGTSEERKNERPTASPLDSVTPSVGKVKKRRQPFTRHTGNSVQKKWTNSGVLCILQLVNGLAGWYDESRPSNAEWCKEWKDTEWRDVVLLVW